MLRSIKAKIIIDYDAPGFHNPPLRFKYKKFSGIISAGTDDDIKIIKENDLIFVCSENSRLDYWGVESFDLRNDADNKNMTPKDNFFDQNNEFPELEGTSWSKRLTFLFDSGLFN